MQLVPATFVDFGNATTQGSVSSLHGQDSQEGLQATPLLLCLQTRLGSKSGSVAGPNLNGAK